MPDTPETPAKPELKSAATNPWYVLMTVAGEQRDADLKREDWSRGYDSDLHARNRRLWNGWAAQALDKGVRATLVADGRASEEDLAGLTDEERSAIDEALGSRCPGARRPDPAARPDLGFTEVEAEFIADGFLFPQGAIFESVTFSGRAHFGSATFSERADFGRVTFSGSAEFESATFSGSADFESATFLESADFESVSFLEYAVFGSAAFRFANFTFASFASDAIFRNTSFLGHAVFASTTFSRDALFEDAIVSGNAIFRQATFSREAEFQSATFSAYVAFESATFFGTVDFSNVVFKAVTSFRPARDPDSPCPPTRFLRHPPEFFGATLHENTIFTDVEWPPVPIHADLEVRRALAIRHRRAYERLKLLMDSQKRVADELMFQRLELRCREAEAVGDWQEREWWVARVSRLFGVLSDYGWDPVRPALWVAGLVLAGWALIFLAEWADFHLGGWPDPARSPEYLGFLQSGMVSGSNLFGFLGFNRTFLAEEVRTLTAFSEIVSAAQTVFGLILFFLLGLALRNRFRIK